MVFFRKGKMYEIQLLIILHFKTIKVSNISSQKIMVLKKRRHSDLAHETETVAPAHNHYSLEYSVLNNVWTKFA